MQLFVFICLLDGFFDRFLFGVVYLLHIGKDTGKIYRFINHDLGFTWGGKFIFNIGNIFRGQSYILLQFLLFVIFLENMVVIRPYLSNEIHLFFKSWLDFV